MGMTHFFVRHLGQPEADRIMFSLPTAYFRRLFDLVEIWRREGALYMPWLEQFWQVLRSELEKQGSNGNWQTELNNLRKRLGETLSWVHLPLAWLENLRRREGEDYGP